MDDTTLDAIKDTAKRAAWGWGAEWRTEEVPADPDTGEWFTVHADGKRDMVGSEDGDVARHIAGMDPAATLALVARVEAAEAKVAAAEALHGKAHWCFGGDDPNDLREDTVFEPGTEWWPCPTLAALATTGEGQ